MQTRTHTFTLLLLLFLSYLSVPPPVSAHEFREHSPGPSGSAVLYLFFFSGEGCDSCSALKPLVKAAETRYRGLVGVVEVNVDNPRNHDFAQEISLSGIPTMYVVGRHGEQFSRLEGYGESSEVLADLAMALPKASVNAASGTAAADGLAPVFLKRIQQASASDLKASSDGAAAPLIMSLRK